MTELVNNRWLGYTQLMRINKPIGMLLLLWPTLWALWCASKGMPPLTILVIFIIGGTVMRSAGCVINDVADRDFDGYVQRTQFRPLVKGSVTLVEAWLLFIVLSLFGFVCVWYLNTLTIVLGIIGLTISVIYPFMKRITDWPQLVLGIAFAWGVPMAYAALTGGVPLPALALFAITYCWVVAYDTIYAMVDREDDIKIGVRSTAIRLGKNDVKFVLTLQSAVLLGLLLFAYWQDFGPLFYPAWLVGVLLVVYQVKLIQHRDPQQCFKAFLNNHWFGFVIFAGVVLSV